VVHSLLPLLLLLMMMVLLLLRCFVHRWHDCSGLNLQQPQLHQLHHLWHSHSVVLATFVVVMRM